MRLKVRVERERGGRMEEGGKQNCRDEETKKADYKRRDEKGGKLDERDGVSQGL